MRKQSMICYAAFVSAFFVLFPTAFTQASRQGDYGAFVHKTIVDRRGQHGGKWNMEHQKFESATPMNLFSLNMNGDNNKRDNDDDDDLDDLNFPAWVRGLRQWPLYPTILNNNMPPPDLEEEKEVVLGASRNKEENAKEQPIENHIPIPLASLINVEALLMASGEETMDDVTELEHFASRNFVGESEKDKIVADSLEQAKTINATKNMDNSKQEMVQRPEMKYRTPLSILPSLEELGDWDKFVGTLQRSIVSPASPEAILKEATARIEDFVSDASLAISPSTVQDLIVKASRTLTTDVAGEGTTTIEEVANNIVEAAEKLAKEKGLNVSEAAERARETTKYTTSLVTLANGLLVSGYVRGDAPKKRIGEDTKDELSSMDGARPLFDGYASVSTIADSEYARDVAKAAEMGSLAGAIYQDTVPRTHGLGHAIVGNGTTSDVTWMVTDSIAYQDEFGQETNDSSDGSVSREPIFVRTITIRGFDASDESIDREKLLNTICTATPESFGVESGVLLHSGLLSIARDLYRDIVKYIDMTAPTHRIVLNGHSVGGSLATLLLFLLTEERGADFVREKVLRVFSFGSPPIATMSPALKFQTPFLQNQDYLTEITTARNTEIGHLYRCDILKAFDLPSSIVYGYIQPWDPIVRLFSNEDALYPLLGDMGPDGKTVYASGPARSLRPIVRAIVESWQGWPLFRDTFRSTVSQNYTCVGTQHMLLPEPIRYLSDRLVSVNVAVPPVDTVLRISPSELFPALRTTFPLDVFSISFVPAAIRSFVHHFYPAYDFPIVDYSAKKQKKRGDQPLVVNGEKELTSQVRNGVAQASNMQGASETGGTSSNMDWAGVAAQWMLGGDGSDKEQR